MNKDFTNWNDLKQNLDKLHRVPTFKEGEIWWCSVGINIGHEIFGKNKLFNRPVLIVRKFNNHIFLGLPLSTKIKENRFYHAFDFKGKKQSAMLSQIRVLDSRRITHKLGEVSELQLNEIKERIKEMI